VRAGKASAARPSVGPRRKPAGPARGRKGLAEVGPERSPYCLRASTLTDWNDDDYDVLADGAVVGRILKVHATPVGSPWKATLVSVVTMVGPGIRFNVVLEREAHSMARSRARCWSGSLPELAVLGGTITRLGALSAMVGNYGVRR
jgi:hypothetical protein